MRPVALLVGMLAAAALAACSAQQMDQNTYSGMVRRTPTCEQRYADLEGAYFPDPATGCKAEVRKAVETYVVSNCPSVAVGSLTWACMSGYNASSGMVSQARIDSWMQLVTRCELFYIANRFAGESESDGFRWIDNSCFPRFNDLQAFAEYLAGRGGGPPQGAASPPRRGRAPPPRPRPSPRKRPGQAGR